MKRPTLFTSPKKETLRTGGIYTFLLIATLPIIVGYSWLLIGSFQRDVGLIGKAGFTLKNWTFLWERPFPMFPDLWPTFLNTLWLASGVTIMVVLVSISAGYVISRVKFRGRTPILAFTLILHAFPGITLLLALYYILRAFQLLDTIVGIILVRAGLNVPLAVWIMKGFFDGIPWDIEMSAAVDGANRFQIWRKIMIPLVGPGIAAVSLFSFISGWGEFIFLTTFVGDPRKWTLTSYVGQIISEHRFTNYGLLAAASQFYMIPVLLFFIFTQKYLMKVTLGGSIRGGR